MTRGSEVNMELQWSPVNKNHIIFSGNENISLYYDDAATDSLSDKSNRSTDNLIDKITRYPFPKVVDVYPGNEDIEILAVGLGNGKVVITAFDDKITTKEFTPKHARVVTSLQWNSKRKNLLAAGWEKLRSDYSLAIWDVSTNKSIATGSFPEFLKPMFEDGANELVSSLSWVSANSLLVGLNGKYIKLFDLRDFQHPGSLAIGSSTSTKAIHGITIDPINPSRVASVSETQIFLWDLRNFDKPFVVLSNVRPVVKVRWCPTRSGLIASFGRSQPFVTLHDAQHSTVFAEETEQSFLERKITPRFCASIKTGEPVTICSFDWHPHKANTLTTLSEGGIFTSTSIYERVTLNWSPTSKLCWSDGKELISYIDNTDKVYASLDDVSIKMKHRAFQGYGMKATLRENAFLAEDLSLKNLWEWLDYCTEVTEREKYRVSSVSSCKYPGAKIVLQKRPDFSSSIDMKSEVVEKTVFSSHSVHKIYRSPERSFIQQLCGWGLEFLSKLTGSATRKSAVALFHMKLQMAIKFLNDSGDSVAAMAIAGFSEDRTSLWRGLAHSISSKLSDPYLRAMFSFLMDNDNNYTTILNDRSLALVDRLGFACSFLSDDRLIDYINELSESAICDGNLDGIFLTGMTNHCIPLLQKYLDITGDVQTVSLLAITTMPADIPASPFLKAWIERYRELLDSWKLWEQRAHFDIKKNANSNALIPPPDVYIACNFCGKSISSRTVSSLPRGQPLGRLDTFSRYAPSSTKVKLSCCSSCRKPLPRCSICLLHMGTAFHNSDPIVDSSKHFTPQFMTWFTWCESCRHGGHTVHITEWFEEHSECPVSGCTCKCSSLDKVIDCAEFYNNNDGSLEIKEKLGSFNLSAAAL